MNDNRNLRNRNVGFINQVTRSPVQTHFTVLIAGVQNSTKYMQGLLPNSQPYKPRRLIYVAPTLLFKNTSVLFIRLPGQTFIISQHGIK
jgi:hypothetical protein